MISVLQRMSCSCHLQASVHNALTKLMFFQLHVRLKHQYSKFIIAGGGTGGITMAAKILGLGEKDVTIIEPSEIHYYQAYWTLVGGRKKNFKNSFKPMQNVLPHGAKWMKDKVAAFEPSNNIIHTENNGLVKYSYLIVALGICVSFERIKGLPAAFDTPGICSNYSPCYVTKTAEALDALKEGNAIFTQPVNPIKCAGAPQKIMYLAEEYFSKNKKRNKVNIIFNTALGTIFSCPKYARALQDVAKNKNITVNYLYSLKEVKAGSKEAVFDKLNEKGLPVDSEVFKYDLLHVVPPMVAPSVIKESSLADSSGFLDVNKHTLQSTKYPNIFGIGDCTNVPTSKTAAAIAGQCGILMKNLSQALKRIHLTNMYNGYTACPLVTGYGKGIMAEFDYNLDPMETLPVDQGKERYISYFLKADVMPVIYWNMLLKGHWSGPAAVRKMLHLWLVK